jgi:hypothetical protein
MLKGVTVQATKDEAYRGRKGIDSFINLGINRLHATAAFTPVPTGRRLGGPYTWSGMFCRKNILYLMKTEPTFLGSRVCSIVPIQTELYRPDPNFILNLFNGLLSDDQTIHRMSE